MSFSQANSFPRAELGNFEAFFTEKNGNSISNCRICQLLILQLSFFTGPIWLGRMCMRSMTLIIESIALLFSLLEKLLILNELGKS